MDLVKLLRKHSDSYFMINKKENGFSSIEERRMEELKWFIILTYLFFYDNL